MLTLVHLPSLLVLFLNSDPIFLALYRELYFRHVYARLRPNIDDRFHSYEASCELFNFLLNSDGPVSLELPAQWLWDVLDEFIYQFQSFGQVRPFSLTSSIIRARVVRSRGEKVAGADPVSSGFVLVY